jgi:hypothetical protein
MVRDKRKKEEGTEGEKEEDSGEEEDSREESASQSDRWALREGAFAGRCWRGGLDVHRKNMLRQCGAQAGLLVGREKVEEEAGAAHRPEKLSLLSALPTLLFGSNKISPRAKHATPPPPPPLILTQVRPPF